MKTKENKLIIALKKVVADPENIKEEFQNEMKKIIAKIDSLYWNLVEDEGVYCKEFREMEPKHPAFVLLRDFEKKLDIALEVGNKIIESLN
jgi:hypothetical protein